MTSDEPSSEVETVEWAAVESRRRLTRRDRGFLASLLALTALAGYLHFVKPTGEPLPVVGFWEPLLVDWMFYAAWLVFAFYVIWPLLRPGSVLRENWPAILQDRLGLVSLVWLVGFLIVGTAEPLIVDRIAFNPIQQPPFGFSIFEGFVGDCVGRLVDEQCHGSLAHPFGTTGNGRDVLLLTIAGARTALQMVLITAAIIVPIGVGVGTFAGYVGGRVDEALMRYVDTQQSIPALFVYVALAVLYGPSLTLMVVVFGFLNWEDVARLVRSEVLRVREAEFIAAAQGAGVDRLQVIRHHVIPNVSPTVLSITALKLPLLVIIETTLSYLKFGDPQVVSWGNIVSVTVIWAEDPTIYWWIGAFPIGVLVLTTIAISLFGNTLQDAIDPRRAGGDGR